MTLETRHRHKPTADVEKPFKYSVKTTSRRAASLVFPKQRKDLSHIFVVSNSIQTRVKDKEETRLKFTA